jgi:hypothetical protein
MRRTLLAAAFTGLALGLAASFAGMSTLAQGVWATGTLPVIIALLLWIVRVVLAGRMGVDAVALVSMSAALILGEGLAAAVVAVMYSGGKICCRGPIRRWKACRQFCGPPCRHRPRRIRGVRSGHPLSGCRHRARLAAISGRDVDRRPVPGIGPCAFQKRVVAVELDYCAQIVIDKRELIIAPHANGCALLFDLARAARHQRLACRGEIGIGLLGCHPYENEIDIPKPRVCPLDD